MSEYDYEYFVFSGGSIKGVAFLGALQVLEKYGVMGPHIKGYAGTSAGSIIAAMMAIGLSYTEIGNYMVKLDTTKIPDDKFGFIRDTKNLFTHYGVCEGNYLYNYVGDIIKTHCGNKNYTIEQLYKDTNIILVIPITNVNTMETVYLNPHHEDAAYRCIPIRLAIRMSTSIPYMFEPIKYNGCSFVDGGLIDNYPINVFDGDTIGSIDQCLGKCEPNSKVLGFKLITTREPNQWTSIDSFVNFGLKLIDMFLVENDRKSLTKSNKKRTINILTDNYPLMDFTMDTKKQTALINAGIKATFEFLDQH